MPAAATDKLRKSYSLLQKTLSSGISDSDTTITPNNGTNIPTDTAVDFIIDRVDANGNRTDAAREIVTGVFNGSAFTNCVRGKDGTTAQSHSAGAVIEFTLTGDQWNDAIDQILTEHNQDGTHSDINATSITATTGTFTNLTISGQSNDGWNATGGTHSVSTGYNSGNRSFEIATSTDLSGIVSPGMRYRVTRGTTPPTQCADLEYSSSHYASKTSPTGLPSSTTVSAEAWVKLESYTGSSQYILADNSANNGFGFYIGSDGTVTVFGGSSSVYDVGTTYQSIPLNKWVHLVATLTINSAAAVYIDGVSVPVNYTNSAATTLGTPGTLYLGRQATAAAGYFDGKIADVRVWSDIRTATEIQDNMYAYPSDTTGLVAHFKLNGDFTDASSNGNDLTAQNSAVATNADNPWNATEYGIITKVTASTIQVFCPEGYGIPNETLTAPFYSTQSAPFGFPRGRDKWSIETLCYANVSQVSPSAGTWYNPGSLQVSVPQGSWTIGYQAVPQGDNSGTGSASKVVMTTLSTSSSSSTDKRFDSSIAVTSTYLRTSVSVNNLVNIDSSTPYYLLIKNVSGATSNIYFISSEGSTVITAECAYL